MAADRRVRHPVQLEQRLRLRVVARGDLDRVALRAQALDDRAQHQHVRRRAHVDPDVASAFRQSPAASSGIERVALHQSPVALGEVVLLGLEVGPRGRWRSPRRSRVMSSSTRPRVVSAGVPIRRPEGFIGGRSSKGIALRLTVIPTSSSRSSAVLPSRPVGRQVDEDEVDVGAAGEDRDAARFEARRRSACALAIVCRWRAAELLAGGDPQRDRLGGDRVHQRPALLAGEDRFVDRLARAPRGRGSCRCAGRRGSCGSSS